MNQALSNTFDQNESGLLIANKPIPLKYLQTLGATSGQVPTFNGTTVEWATGGSGSGVEFGAPAVGFTPGFFQYVDTNGDQYGDELAIRDSVTNITHIDRTFVTSGMVDVTSGLDSYDNIAGFGLRGTMLKQSDGTNVIEGGVFDTTDVGGGPLTFGVVSIAGTGQQTTWLMNGGTSPSSTMQFQAANNDQTQVLYLPTSFHLETRLNSGQATGFESDGVNASWFANNHHYALPTSLPTTNQVLTATAVSGNNVTLGWSSGGGGGSSHAPQYSIQSSDGAGGFSSTANLLYNYTDNVIYANLEDGLYVDSDGDNYEFGRFLSAEKKNYFQLDNGYFEYTNTQVPSPTINFIGTGVNNFSLTSLSSYNILTPTTYYLTIDSPQFESGTFYSGTGLDDGVFSGIYSGTRSVSIVASINSMGTPDTFDWTDSNGNSGNNVPLVAATPILLTDGISITFAADTGHSNGDTWAVGYNLGTVTYYVSQPGGPLTDGEPVTTGGKNAVVGKYVTGTPYVSLTQQSAPFAVGDVLLGSTSGNSVTITGLQTNYGIYGAFGDMFTWADGASVNTSNPIFSGYGITMSHNLVANYSTSYGHVLTDQTNFTVTPVDLVLMQWNPAQYQLSFGDVGGGLDNFRMELDLDANTFKIANNSANMLFADAENRVVSIGNSSKLYAYIDSDLNHIFQVLDGTNGTNFGIDDTNKKLYYLSEGATQFKIDKLHGIYAYGDLDNVNTGWKSIMDANSEDYLLTSSGGDLFHVTPQRMQSFGGNMYTDLNGSTDSWTLYSDRAATIPILAATSATILATPSTLFNIKTDGDFKVTNTNDKTYFDIDNTNHKGILGDTTSDFLPGGTFVKVDWADDQTKSITFHGGMDYSSIDSVAYGTTNSINRHMHQLVTHGSTGATTFNLDDNYSFGQEFTFSDRDRISSTSNITIDAQTGNVIVSTVASAQTFVINNDGESITIRLIDNSGGVNTWMVI